MATNNKGRAPNQDAAPNTTNKPDYTAHARAVIYPSKYREKILRRSMDTTMARAILDALARRIA